MSNKVYNKVINPLGLTFGTSLLLNALLWIVSFTVFPRNDPTAVLHYSIDIGVDFIGSGNQILRLPATGLALLIANGLLGYLIRRVDIRSAWILWGALPAIQLILIGSFFLVWNANR